MKPPLSQDLAVFSKSSPCNSPNYMNTVFNIVFHVIPAKHLSMLFTLLQEMYFPLHWSKCCNECTISMLWSKCCNKCTISMLWKTSQPRIAFVILTKRVRHPNIEVSTTERHPYWTGRPLKEIKPCSQPIRVAEELNWNTRCDFVNEMSKEHRKQWTKKEIL